LLKSKQPSLKQVQGNRALSAFGIKQRHILILDDHTDDRLALKQGLKALDFISVSEAADPIAALDIMHAKTVDVLITERFMPFIKFLRTSDKRPAPYMPIIMVCKNINAAERQDAINAGVNRVISKPTIAKNLLLHITNVLEEPQPFVETSAYVGPDRRRSNKLTEAPRGVQNNNGALGLTPEEIAVLLERD
jgi:two-component system chemotaxis response regulator CheY